VKSVSPRKVTRRNPGVSTQRERVVESLRRAFGRGAIPAPIHQIQRLARVRQRHDQGVVAPHPVVGDVHPFLARPGGFGERAIGLNERLVEERRGLLAPHAHPRRVDRRLQGLDRRAVKASTEVPRRRRVWNPLRAQRVEIALVLAAQLNVLQARPAAQDVIGDTQDVIRLVIR